MNEALIRAATDAQESLLPNVFTSAEQLCRAACEQAGVDGRLADGLPGELLLPFADQPKSRLVQRLAEQAQRLGVSATAVALVADRIQLLRAFKSPDAILDQVRTKVEHVVTQFPRTAAQIERGRNPGDLLDPFITAATQELMFAGDFQGAIGATVSHKAMMMVEGLIGHLHEDVIGSVRGNVRVPEPRGVDQEHLDLQLNPCPGADVLQPPWREGEQLRFHQIKSKMGSAKGGDGHRLGLQLQLLETTYEAETYYDALIGRSLTGHRSMAGVLRASPNTVVLVGAAALNSLTGSPIGGELLLRLYQQAFRDVASATGYTVQTVSSAIAAEFRRRAEEQGEDFLVLLVEDVTSGPAEHQSSRTSVRRRRGGTGRSRPGSHA